ncbi:albusnodin/ikarugamycin family macrolactam cyclase [Tychonema sp. LEGE 06208]|uniref:albusnodin/ikarugamycin family macrolactam cyclase n=1 Tax=Tychonema sp. LEGE 06208 TaxID=1828663 RepID=UPI001A0B9585|nr:albusnodin/ikarugamycin family macrolactam cyclase [Tychonema sp. LEGE 06208]MBE9162969.1 albusnodin/ikarugamycin family macrolactam cyclase [Tychonema sp. LEGE 06208]
MYKIQSLIKDMKQTMFRWFYGFLAEAEDVALAFAKPCNSQIIWKDKSYLFLCGSWKKTDYFYLSQGEVELAIIGRLLIHSEPLFDQINLAVRTKDYRILMKLPGNYNLIVKDGNQNYIFTDRASLKPIFYTVKNSSIVYSSHCVAIKELIDAKVNLSWLAAWLMYPGMIGIDKNSSPFCNIQIVPPGHYLQVSPGKVVCEPYWTEPTELKDRLEAAEQLREQLIAAVERRVDLYDIVTSDLSGGMDSTSLSLIAAKTLANQGRKLHTITFASSSVTELEDLKYAQQAASFYPNISSVVLDSNKFPMAYSNLDEMPMTDEPAPVATTLGRFLYGLEVVKSKGSQLHLSGDGGDAVLLAPYSYLADLVQNAHLGTLIRHSFGWAKVKNISPIALISNSVKLATTSYRRWLLQQTKKLKSGQISYEQIQKIIAWSSPPSCASWYTQKTTELVIQQLQQYMADAKPFSNQPGQHGAIESIYAMGRSCRILQQVAEIYGVNLDVPYLDSLVVDACLCARTEEKTTPFMFKPLLHAAFRYDLPEIILNRTTKGDYTRDMFDGIRQNQTQVNELLQSSCLADLGLIDLEKFRIAIENFSMGFNIGLCQFEITLEVEFWLRSVLNSNHFFDRAYLK